MTDGELIDLGFSLDNEYGRYGVWNLTILYTDLIKVSIKIQLKGSSGYIIIYDPWGHYIMHNFVQPITYDYLKSIVIAAKTLFNEQSNTEL